MPWPSQVDYPTIRFNILDVVTRPAPDIMPRELFSSHLTSSRSQRIQPRTLPLPILIPITSYPTTILAINPLHNLAQLALHLWPLSPATSPIDLALINIHGIGVRHR